MKKIGYTIGSMKLFKIMLGLGTLVVFLLGTLTLGIAAVTKPLEYPEMAATITPEVGTVQLQRAGSASWETVTVATEVSAGDTVQTGAESRASINMYDQGVLHVAPDTTLVVQTAVWDSRQPEVFQGEVILQAGNLWSRVFDFVSPQSSYQVRTSSTVATVRGTTFWVGTEGDAISRVYVDHHAVEVQSLVSDDVVEVTEGQMAELERTGARAQLALMNEPRIDIQQAIELYRAQDATYAKEVQTRRLEAIKDMRKIDPESSLYRFRRVAEHLRLSMAGNAERREELRARFMAGRVLDAYLELHGHEDRVRARILLRHAREFGGERFDELPEVRRAVWYFGGLEGEQSLERLEESLEEAVVEEGEESNGDGLKPTDRTEIEVNSEGRTDVEVKVDAVKDPTTMDEPVVRGVIDEKVMTEDAANDAEAAGTVPTRATDGSITETPQPVIDDTRAEPSTGETTTDPTMTETQSTDTTTAETGTLELRSTSPSFYTR